MIYHSAYSGIPHKNDNHDYFATFIKQKIVDAKSEKMTRFFICGFIFFVFITVELKTQNIPRTLRTKIRKNVQSKFKINIKVTSFSV